MRKRDIRQARKQKARLFQEPDRWVEETTNDFMQLLDELTEARLQKARRGAADSTRGR